MIRKATTADIESITAIYNEAILEGGFSGYLEPLSIENRRAWFLDHRQPFSVFARTIDGQVVGYVALSPYRGGRGAFRETCEISYYFASRHRGLGLGKETILHAIEQARLSGFRMMVAMILESNRRSINLLLGLGFVISGNVPNAAQINGTYVDHLYLSRDLRA